MSKQETKDLEVPGRLEDALNELPIFPLGQVILYPRALLPLHIFEQRYRTLIKDCLSTHRAMAIALVTDPSNVDAHGNPAIAQVAGAGIIVEHQELPDGRSNILLHGSARVRLEELPFVPPYRRAKATILSDVNTPVTADNRTALLAAAHAFAAEVHKRDPNFSLHLPPGININTLADLCAHHLVVDVVARQAILEELDVAQRVERVISELALQQSSLLRESGGVLH
jgi:Lon protease-like protein